MMIKGKYYVYELLFTIKADPSAKFIKALTPEIPKL